MRAAYGLCLVLLMLLVCTAAACSTLTWDPEPNDAGITDGSGTWDYTHKNWTSDGGSTHTTFTAGDCAIFGGGSAGSAGTITVSGTIRTDEITSNTPNGGGEYTITGGSLEDTGGAVLDITTNNDLKISSGVANLAAVAATYKDGAGTLILTGTNTRGSFTIFDGTVIIGDGGTSGSLGTGSVVSSTSSNAIVFNRSNQYIVDNIITGPGSVRTSGTGDVVLTGANTYTGVTTIDSGSTLQVGNGGTTGTLGTGTVNDDGVLSVSRSDSFTFPNEICGTGEVRQIGSGTTFLTGDSCYSGATRITGGSLQIGNAGTSGTLGSGSIENDASLVYNRTDYYIAGNPISGAGSLTVNMGEFKLTGTNTYSGTTTINSGATLRIGYASSATGTLGSGAVTNNGALNFDRSGALSVPNMISGTGSVGQIGSGTTTLTGSNIYTGDTAVEAGTLVIAGPVPASGFFIMHFHGPSEYGLMVLPAAPDLAGKTVNVEIPSTAGPYNRTIISWAGTAAGTPSLMMNGATVTSGEFVGNAALIYGPATGLNVTAFATAPTTTTIPVTTTTTSPPSNGGDDPTGGVNLPGQPVVVQPPSPPSTVDVNVGGNSAVTGVTVTGTGIGDMIVTATVQPGPAEGMSAAPGDVYQYLTLEPARYTTITGAEITFSVPESWITEQKLTHDMIAMNRYAGKQWNTLPTRFLKTENGHAFFSSTSPGFSYFAIIGISRSSTDVDSEKPSGTQTMTEPTQGSVTRVPGTTVTTGTLAVPAQSPSKAEPPALLVILASIGIGGVALVAVGIIARRWWIRRQNPDLFEDEK